MKNTRIYEKKEISPSMWVIECPLCGKYLASASEKMYLPQFSICDCLDTEKKEPKTIRRK